MDHLKSSAFQMTTYIELLNEENMSTLSECKIATNVLEAGLRFPCTSCSAVSKKLLDLACSVGS